MSFNLVYVSIIIGISISVDQVKSDYDIYKYPMELEPGNWIINAIITDENINQRFTIREYISSGSIVRGKIWTESKGNGQKIHYSSEYPTTRYVIKDDNANKCWKFIFTNDWNYRLSDTPSPFVSYFLMAGPSILFRLKNQPIQWNQTSDVEVNGVAHHVYESYLTPKIGITYYYKVSRDGSEFSFPSRVFFKGNSNVRMDIYSIKKVDQELDSFVTLTEKNCDAFLTKGLDYHESPIPKVGTQFKHYIALETISSDKNQLIQKEVFADEKFQLVNVRTTIKLNPDQIEKKPEKVYDYTLGLVYELNHEDEQRKCQMYPMDSSAPGLLMDKTNPSFSLNQQFNLNGQYFYIGPVSYMNLFNTQLKAEGWQENIKKGKIDDINYDLVIATQYILPLVETNDEKDMVVVGTTFDGYAKTDRTIRKKIYYQIISTEFDDSKDKFHIADCYPDPESRKTLELRFSCKDQNCGHFTRNHHKQFTIKLKESIFGMETISISRISNIELIFKSYETIAQITVLESPDIMDSFEHKEIRIAKKSKPRTSYYDVKNHRECLISSANIVDRFESFSYCKYLDGSECLIASSPISSENTTNDTHCSTNEINLLKRFDKIETRKFIKSTSIPTDNDPKNCAERCSDSSECKSFQYCSDSGSCTLESYYTDSSTDFSPNCDIYVPKVIDKFRMTGKQIISDTFHTELSVIVDQCAALCDGWSEEENSKSCLSFNFCSANGRTSSICLLSRYDFDDVFKNSGEVKLIHEDGCRNYNRIKKKTESGTIKSSIVLRSSFNLSGSLFIVFLFIISGLIIGFIVNTIYTKVMKRKSTDKSTSSTFNRNTFSWTRQLNDERQSTFRQSTITVQENDESESIQLEGNDENS